MGQPKQLLDVGGVTLLRRSAQVALLSPTSKVVVVLGSNETQHREALEDLPVEFIVNHYWKSGMGSSIKTGLHYVIREHEEAQGVMMMVCDQPALSSLHLDALIKTYTASGKKIVASSYDSTLGVPAIFGRSFYSNILMLGDEQGARKIIDQFSDQVVSVPFPEGNIDLDTMEDYSRYLATKKITDLRR